MKKRLINARNLRCPMPIIELSKAIKDVRVGEEVEIQATDPVFRADLEAWCRKTGNAIKHIEENQGCVFATIEKKAA